MAKGSDVMTKAQNRVRLLFQEDMCGKVIAELSLWHPHYFKFDAFITSALLSLF